MISKSIQQSDQTDNLIQRFRQKPARRRLGLKILERKTHAPSSQLRSMTAGGTTNRQEETNLPDLLRLRSR